MLFHFTLLLVLIILHNYIMILGYLHNKIINKNYKQYSNIINYRQLDKVLNNNKQKVDNNEFEHLNRKVLQKLAKENNIKANMKSSEIILKLQNLMILKSNNNLEKNNLHNKKLIPNDNEQINNTVDLKEFLLIEKLKKGDTNKVYEYTAHREGLIANEYFQYIPRNYECKEIVQYMLNRQISRKRGNAKDKMNNPLIAIPGSPGIGKSTFLTYFPDSQYYKDYVNNVFGNTTPIVSPLTFNSKMTGGEDLFELRIIYGACISMGLICDEEYSWDDFYERFFDSKLNLRSTIKILQNVFGADRPILILVDELSKANTPNEIMKTISKMLDSFGNIDIIVSSLSPGFVQSLLTGSNRPIEYTIMTPLINSDLGKNECHEWANTLINKVSNTNKVDEYKANLLRNVYLLYSGHPRSLEIFVKNIQSSYKNWDIIENDLQPNANFANLLNSLVRSLVAGPSISELDTYQLENYVFRHPITFYEESATFRILIECGKLLIHKRNNNKEFITCVSAISILKLIYSVDFDKFKEKGGRCGNAYFFLKSFYMYERIGVIWEKIVLLNIILTSNDVYSASNLLGVKLKSDFLSSNWSIQIVDKKQLNTNTKNNTLIIPSDPFHPGNDGIIILYNKSGQQQLYFLQIKVSFSVKRDIVKVIISMIIYNLLEYLRDFDQQQIDKEIQLDNVNMIIYIWDCDQDIFNIFHRNESNEFTNITWHQIMEVVDNKYSIIESNEKNIPSAFNKTLVKLYISKHFDQVYFVGKDKLQTWLCPSFLPFPMLATAVEKEEEVKEEELK